MDVTNIVTTPERDGTQGGGMADTDQCGQLSRLLTRCATGDRTAFRHLYDLSSRYVFGVALAITHDHDTARDVAQEAYVRIWKRAGLFRPEGGNPLSWIGAIARNCAIDRLRSDRTRGFIRYTDEVPEISDGRDSAGQAIDCMVLRKLLADLRPDYRRALMLCYFQGYTYIELASVLDIPVGTAKSWVRRGLASLREALQ